MARDSFSGLGRRVRWAAAVVALALLVAPASAIESDPVSLGADGLDLVVSLLKWTEASGEWVAADASGVTVVAEGDGHYSLAGLPAATGTDRYAATIALSADADRGLHTYHYGSVPGVRMVWREEIALPSQPLIFRRGDSYGSLALTVRRGLPAEACAATVTASAANSATGALLFEDAAATVSDCELDVTTGTYGATFSKDLSATDLDEAGRYVATFEVCYAVDECQTLPSTNVLRFEVVRRLGD